MSTEANGRLDEDYEFGGGRGRGLVFTSRPEEDFVLTSDGSLLKVPPRE